MSAPIAIVRTPYAQVQINGIPIAPVWALGSTIVGPTDGNVGVLSVHTAHGFDLRVAEATITLTGKPSYLDFNLPVSIYVGASQNTALGSGARFIGSVVEIDYTHWPRDVSVLCRGNLYKAQTFQLGNTFTFNDATHSDPFPLMGGLDFSNTDNHGVAQGYKDEDMVLFALDLAGVPNNGLLIGGTGKLFGTVMPEHMRWSVGQSALDFIDTLDTVCLGYRTFEIPGGGVVRELVSIIPSTDAIWTFTEGVDIISGTGSDDVLASKRYASVTGGTPTGATGPAFTFTADSHSATNSMYDSVSSAYLEKSATADAGPGLSCEEVANWRLTQVQYPLLKRQFETPRDDFIRPGDTVRINAPLRLGTSRTYFVQRVECDLTETGVFTQKLTCVGLAS